ncbi:hypothetical protein M3Y99_01635800 [Aphelenchoides fujianensis]|nr:hypothetical protein M3Y99_01635800 [Aphelenchoides fujianensis]
MNNKATPTLTYEAKCALARFYVHDRDHGRINEDRRKRLIQVAKINRRFINPMRLLLRNATIAADIVNPKNRILTLHSNEKVLLTEGELCTLLRLVNAGRMAMQLQRFEFQPSMFESLKQWISKWISLPAPTDYSLPMDGITRLSIVGNDVDQEFLTVLRERASSLTDLECSPAYLGPMLGLPPMQLRSLKLPSSSSFQEALLNSTSHSINHLDLSSAPMDRQEIDSQIPVRDDLFELTLDSNYSRLDDLHANVQQMKSIAPNLGRLNSTCRWTSNGEGLNDLLVEIFDRAQESANQLLNEVDFVTLNFHCNAYEDENKSRSLDSSLTELAKSSFFADKNFTADFQLHDEEEECGNYVDAHWSFSNPRWQINISIAYQQCSL